MVSQGRISPELDRVIDTWGLMELRLSGAVDVDDVVSVEISSDCLAEIKKHPLADHLMALPRYGPAVGIDVTIATSWKEKS